MILECMHNNNNITLGMACVSFLIRGFMWSEAFKVMITVMCNAKVLPVVKLLLVS